MQRLGEYAGELARRMRREVQLVGWPMFLFGCFIYLCLVLAVLCGLVACVAVAVTSFG